MGQSGGSLGKWFQMFRDYILVSY